MLYRYPRYSTWERLEQFAGKVTRKSTCREFQVFLKRIEKSNIFEETITEKTLETVTSSSADNIQECFRQVDGVGYTLIVIDLMV